MFQSKMGSEDQNKRPKYKNKKYSKLISTTAALGGSTNKLFTFSTRKTSGKEMSLSEYYLSTRWELASLNVYCK